MDEVCYIDEHPVGSRVIIEVQVDGRKQNLDSYTLEATGKSKNKYVLLPVPTKVNIATGKEERVRIGGERIHLTISNDAMCHAYNYYSSKFGYVKIDEEYFLAVFSNDPAMPANRREAYRLSISGQAVIRDDVGREYENCHLRDISVTGISLIVDNDDEMKIGVNHYIKITFQYNMQDSNQVFRLTAQVVRVLRNDKVAIIGARFKEENASVNELCAFLMREELRISNKYNR